MGVALGETLCSKRINNLLKILWLMSLGTNICDSKTNDFSTTSQKLVDTLQKELGTCRSNETDFI